MPSNYVRAGHLALALALPSTSIGAQSQVQPLPPNEPTKPYVLHLGRDHATLCWATVEAVVGRVNLFSYSTETQWDEPGPASHYHAVSMDGLQPGRVYRYEIGRNHRGTFTTASLDPNFEVAVFGHPGGTTRPLEYPTELLQGTLLDLSPEIALCTGDLAFQATSSDLRRSFFHKFGDFMARRPIYVAPANHDGLHNGRDYGVFRRLFPHEFGPKQGGSYWFDYKHARFFALTYKLNTRDTFREHVQWLVDAIDASEQEFHLVFLGGAAADYYDKDLLFKTLAKHRVDLVLGGDGGGIWQRKEHGVDFYFSGTAGPAPHPFYHLRFFEYHFDVMSRRAAGNRVGTRHRSFYSKKQRRVVLPLAPKRVEAEPYILRYAGLSRPSTSVRGVHMTVDWDQDFDCEIQLQWKSKQMVGYVREEYHSLRANTKSELLIPVPTEVPNEQRAATYELDEIVIRLAPRGVDFKAYTLGGRISDVYLFDE